MNHGTLPVNGIAALVVSISLAIGAQILFKYGASRIPIFNGSILEWMSHIISTGILAALALYFISAILYIYALRFIPLSIASPTIAISYAIIVLLSAWLFQEPLVVNKVIGVILIGAGVIFLWL